MLFNKILFSTLLITSFALAQAVDTVNANVKKQQSATVVAINDSPVLKKQQNTTKIVRPATTLSKILDLFAN